MESALIPLEPELLSQFFALCGPYAESNFQGIPCTTWEGLHKIPNSDKSNQRGLPLLPYKNKAYQAALIAYAVVQDNENPKYPQAWMTMLCGNIWCVTGEHCRIRVRGENRGRKKLNSLEETVHYKERRELIKSALEANPMMRVVDLQQLLIREKLGGKTETVNAIIAQVRQELRLGRAPARSLAVTSEYV